jgi:Na+-driven multidrug efflux pump
MKGNEKEAKENFTLIICTGAFIGFLICLAGLLFLENIIRGLGASDVLFPYYRDYLIILLIFAPAMFTALSNGKVSATISFLRTLGFITAGLLILPVFLNVTGIWLAVPLAELLALFVSGALIIKYRNLYGYL